jgi:cell fate regulator YaaT (PSP1 superfamily)
MSGKMAIRLRKFGRLCPITGYKEESIKIGSSVIVQTDRGNEFGMIVSYPRGLPKKVARDVRLKKVLRYATDDDIRAEKDLMQKEDEALRIANDKIKEFEARIRIVSAEYIFDLSRLIFYYKLENEKRSVNVKDLKNVLAREFKTKVDFHQVSARDEAMMFGGLGPCGRGLCCAGWLEKPMHVTVKMVKEQGLQISPTKTSGLCGRLMCCLQYESEGAKEEGKP